ncbi:hypothetical protein K440DRAFT_657012 [Wilcoxina mikolae CBS 423.85]|nr:hypothetical protein K440DRAFT_657012 [Wilcoxina mikolae CBS 423.85]
MAPSEIDYYKILGLERHAKDEDIKRSFRKLARDTHPDKNPNDPTAKERFQDLQRAYDTLRDNLERSKYDEDNPYHGRDHERSSTSRAQNGTRSGSGTAKRYTAGPSTHTPGWTNGTARPGTYEGFPQQATRSKAWPYEEWESGAKTHSGFSYQTGGYHRPSASAKPDYEDPYGYRTPKKESAYARTSERTHPTSAKYAAHSSSSSSSPRPKSTSGTNPHSSTNARYAGASTSAATPGTGGGVADYIRERRAKEMAAEEEKRRKEAEERRAREKEAQLRREAEEQIRRQEEERHRKARDRERRRAEEAVRNPYESNGYGGRSTPTPTGYYGYPADGPSPYTSRNVDDDLLREAEQQVKEKERMKAGKPHLSSQSKRRSKSTLRPNHTPPKQWATPFHTPGIPEEWKHEKTGAEDIDVVEATPTARDSPKDYFTKHPNTGPEYIRKDGTGVYPAPSFPLKDPVTEKPTPTKTHADRPQPTMPASYGPAGGSPGLSAKKPKSPRRQPSAQQTQECSSDKENKPKPPNVFAYQESSPTPGNEKPVFSKPPDFSFAGANARAFGSFTSNNSPEPQCEKSASSGSGAFPRPRSQPTQTQPSFIPPPSAPPNMQQQQQKAAAANTDGKSKGEDPTLFKRELYEDLLKQAAFSFHPPTSTSSTSSTARRKRSAQTLKKSHTIHRTGSKEAKLDNQPKAESDTDIDEPKATTQSTNSGFDCEPMDAEPTGAPKTIPTPVIPNGNPTIEIKKVSSLDMSGLGAVPPISRSRSPADVGLGNLDSLNDSLPSFSQPSKKLPLSSRVQNKLRTKAPSTSPIGGDVFPNIPPGFWNLYPQTPLEEPFVTPKAPPIPKIPRQTSLDQYNRFYNSLSSYIEAWNKYEAEVHDLRAELTSKSMHVSTTQTLDTQDIVKYMDRVKRKDTILDQSFTKARDKHLAALDSWVRLRESVLKEVTHQEQPH